MTDSDNAPASGKSKLVLIVIAVLLLVTLPFVPWLASGLRQSSVEGAVVAAGGRASYGKRLFEEGDYVTDEKKQGKSFVGDLFGPRPERPELVHVLADHIPNYLDRLAVKPGITGLAQINLPPDSDLESVRRKLTLDLEYITTANLWMECRMFIWTLMRLVAIPASVATRTCGLSRNVKPVKPRTKGPVALANVLDTQTLNDEPMFPYMVD